MQCGRPFIRSCNTIVLITLPISCCSYHQTLGSSTDVPERVTGNESNSTSWNVIEDFDIFRMDYLSRLNSVYRCSAVRSDDNLVANSDVAQRPEERIPVARDRDVAQLAR